MRNFSNSLLSCSPASNFCWSSLSCCSFNAISLSLSAISLSLCSRRFANSPLMSTRLLAGGSPVTPDAARKHRNNFFLNFCHNSHTNINFAEFSLNQNWCVCVCVELSLAKNSHWELCGARPGSSTVVVNSISFAT